ncbi:hypothetical protein BG015_001649 [Linnemannia schmuckeri]|uniref:FAD-binding domain-containing protein n=1 Tax=Linnemannia schmuckeri TaxID=64567 RepID=A0A9P5VDY6_9FUNG|nr:hypothetical protein BG015_001649 [Linnemannia schmuckeri]
MEMNPDIALRHDRSVMYAKRPKVLIIGAGLGGLTLGMLLYKAGIPFEIYERAQEVKPLGSAMYFNSTTASLFKQCGIYDEFLSIGKPVNSIKMCNEKRELDFSMDFAGQEKEFGEGGYIVTRPQMYKLLVRQIPKGHIHMGKKVLSIENGGNGVLIRCSDGYEADGDILVGADGAYSAVRQGLYEKLKKANKLPPSDALPLPFKTVLLAAQTVPLTPDEFPDLALDECQFRKYIDTRQMYSWSTFTTAQNTVAWGSILFLNEETSKENDAFRASEWGLEAAIAMCRKIKDFPIISGGDKILTLKDLMDHTPQNQVSKIMLEEKVFKTWYHCRTVLIGDACHKFNPQGGVGATNAMHDAIVLANLINGLPFHPVAEEIESAFQAYQEERFQWVQAAFESSKVHRTMMGQSVASKSTRLIAKHAPAWVFRRIQVKACSYRPQVAFLPLIEETGRVRPAHQPSLSVKAPVETENLTTSTHAL